MVSGGFEEKRFLPLDTEVIGRVTLHEVRKLLLKRVQNIKKGSTNCSVCTPFAERYPGPDVILKAKILFDQ